MRIDGVEYGNLWLGLSVMGTHVLNGFRRHGRGALSGVGRACAPGAAVELDGRRMRFHGFGWVRPGIAVAGRVLPLGRRRDVLVLSEDATGQRVFAFPEGAPGIAGTALLVAEFDTLAYDAPPRARAGRVSPSGAR